MHRIIYFGDASTSIEKHRYLEQKNLIFSCHAPFTQLAHDYRLQQFLFLQQEHTAQGFQASPELQPFQTVGDYLITNQPDIGIGIMTADCLPVVAWDAQNKAIGIAHAGWKGTLGNIVPQMLDHMHRSFGSQQADLNITFGPAARLCCYQVSAEFAINVPTGPWLVYRNESWYFDILLYVVGQLQRYGITNIDQQQAVCTVCNERFCSYRRSKGTDWRQMSFAAIRP